MNEFYIVDGKLFEVSPDRKQDFLLKYPQAKLKDEQTDLAKTKGTEKGVTVPENATPNTESNLAAGFLEFKLPTPEEIKVKNKTEEDSEELTLGQGLLNEFKNAGDRLGLIDNFWKGDDPSVQLALTAMNEELYGRKGMKALLDAGRDSFNAKERYLQFETVEDLIKDVKEKQQSNRPVFALADAISEKDPGKFAVGVLGTVANAIASVGYGLGTGFTGYAYEYAAENYIEYNERLAKRKNKSLKQLISDNEEETVIPFSIAAGQAGIENLGLGKILGKVLKKGRNKITKYALDIAFAGGVEAGTEWSQYGLGEFNKLLGEGKTKTEALQGALYRMLTEKDAYESMLRGGFGGAGIRGGRYALRASSSVRSTKDSNEIQRNINSIVYNKKVSVETKDEDVRISAEANIEIAKANIKRLIDISNDKIKDLDESSQKKIHDINVETERQVSKLKNLKEKLDNNKINKKEYLTYLDKVKKDYNVSVLRINGVLAKNRGINSLINKSTSFGLKMAEALNIKAKSYETNKEFANAIGKTESEASQIGGAYINGKIYFNKDAASKTFQINIGAHEILHPILNSQIGDKKQQAKIVQGVKERLTSRQIKELDAIMENRGYGLDSGKYETEYLNVMSDALAKNELSLDKTILEKIADFFKSLFKKYDMDIGFENADQVYNFLSEFNKSAKENKVSKKVLDAIDKVKLNKELESESRQFSQAEKNSIIDDLAGPNTKEEGYSISKKQYEEDGYLADAYNRIIEGNLMDALIVRGIQGKTVSGKPISNFIEDVKKELTDLIIKFNPEQNDSFSGYLNGQLQTWVKSKVLKQYAQSKSKSLDVVAGEVGSVAEPGINEDFSEFDTKESFDENTENKIIPSKVFGIESDVKNSVENLFPMLTLDQMTFGSVPLIASPHIAEKAGVKVGKITDPKKNLGAGELKKAQKFLYKHIDDFIKLLPPLTSNKEVTDQNAEGKSVQIATKLINDEKFNLDLYEPADKRVKGAQGNPQFKLPNNFLSNEYKERVLKAFGMDSEGGALITDVKGEILDGRSPESQRVKGALALLSKLTTNTELRIQMLKAGINPNVINNVAAGKSEFQFSQQPDNDIVIPELTNMIFNKREYFKYTRSLYENPEFLEETSKIYDIDLNKEDVKNISLYKYENNVQKWDYEKLLKLKKYQFEFLNSMPDLFKRESSLARSVAGFNGFNSLFNNTLDLYTSESKVLVDKNNNIIRDDRIEKITVFDQEINKNISTKNLKSNKNLSKNDISFINDLNDHIKNNNKKINTLYTLKKLLNDPTLLEDTKKTAILDFKSSKANETRNGVYNLMNQYRLAFVKSGKNKNEIKERLMFITQSLAFENSSIDGLNNLSSLDLSVLKKGTERYSIQNYDSSSKITKQILFDIMSGKEPIVSTNNFKSGVVPTSILEQTPKLSQEQSIKIIKNKTDKNEQLSQVNFNDEVKTLKLESQMGLMLSAKDKRYSLDDIIDVATSKQLAATRKKMFRIIPHSANDLAGLLYGFLGKGKKGEKQLEFFVDNLVKPFSKAIMSLDIARQLSSKKYKQFLKDNPNFNKEMEQETGVSGFNYDQALRVYLYTKNGSKVPGINDTTLQKLKAKIITYPGNKMLKYASSLSSIMRQDSYWIDPDVNSWQTDTIRQDILRSIDQLSRKKFLGPFLENKKAIFSENNINKIRATYGQDFLDPLQDILTRMESGKTRTNGQSKMVNGMLNWIRGSVASTMFLNTRTATLQTLSTFNYINWSDNNIYHSGKALIGNPKQWATDFKYIMNSDYLKERRGGLRTDVNEAEIADAIKRNKGFKGVLGLVLQKGFVFTKAGDAFAIAAGGASFYRNRINTYTAKGFSKVEAQRKAFVDFQEVTEETQQSARADRLSMEQTSSEGRLFLAFQNTPMQYTRLIERAALDLRNGRGNPKEKVSKILYYSFLQNIMFSVLQQGLFSMLFPGQDEDEETKRNERKFSYMANNMVDTLIRGTGVKGAVFSMVKNVGKKLYDENKKVEEGKGQFDIAAILAEVATVGPAISIKTRDIYDALKDYKYKRKSFEKMGISIENPVLDMIGSSASFFNVPLDRVVSKARNVKDALDVETETWQKIALLAGWNRWTVNFEPDDSYYSTKSKGKRKSKKIRLNNSASSRYSKRKKYN